MRIDILGARQALYPIPVWLKLGLVGIVAVPQVVDLLLISVGRREPRPSKCFFRS